MVALDDQIDVKKPDGDAPAERDVVLRVLYGVSTTLAAFQALKGFAELPENVRRATSTYSNKAIHAMERKTVDQLGKAFGMSEGGSLFFARGFAIKYLGQSFVIATHILPAPFWSAIIPFQLHPASRSPALKRTHRALGSAFFLMSTSLMFGFAAIMGKGLQLHPGATWGKGAQGQAVRDMPLLLRAMVPISKPFLYGIAFWFAYTMQRALNAAWRKRFAEHEDWVMRHVASGQWISLMRILLLPGFKLALPYGDTQEVVSSVFYSAGIAAWIACVLGAELAVMRVRTHRALARAARSQKKIASEQPGEKAIGA